ncbi:MAG: DUF1156 domain-containing protein [Planctomycetales bacterium]|nr:DUF1156 domain-containing protein [Planctomycetales bacterium]
MNTSEHTEQRSLAAAPSLCEIPPAARKRLIDVGMLQYESSAAGSMERYRRGETPQTLQVWWARRPHRAMRALVYACLSKSATSDSLKHLHAISKDANVDPESLTASRHHLLKGWKSPPRVLDMFAGGGTIPYEAAVLGADSHGLDSNQLSVSLQQAQLVLSRSVGTADMASVVEDSGKRVLAALRDATSSLYPQRGAVFGYLWTYSLECVNCGYRMLLSKRRWLSKKRNRYVALRIEDSTSGQNCSIEAAEAAEAVESDSKFSTVWCGRDATVSCPKCGRRQKVSLSHTRDELVGVIGLRARAGKTFAAPSGDSVPATDFLLKARGSLLRRLGCDLPRSPIPQWSGIVNPSVYGMKTHADVFNLRQQTVVLNLLTCLRDEHERLKTATSIEVADAVIGILSALVDQLVDWNCRLSMWIPQNEQVGRGFCGPGIAMLWDYCETDPCESGPANLGAKLNRIVAGVRSLSQMTAAANIHHGYAQSLPFEDQYFDAIVTDPPYYDNIFYSVLADFFYAWKRPLLNRVFPSLYSRDVTDSSRELVASTIRSGSPEKAHEDYCNELTLAVGDAARCLKPDGVFALVFSHSSLQGWESIVRAYRASPLVVTSVQPLSIERKQRPRAMTSEAVNTCVVFVARRSDKAKSKLSINELCDRIGVFVAELGGALKDAGWCDADIGVAVFSQAVGLLANASSVVGCENDIEALRRCAKLCSEAFAGFRVVSRKPL